LSHTWSQPEDEILFEDVINGIKDVENSDAFMKIRYACNQARDDSLDYCWIDTCCIDKSSSAELQESINSMFAWYQGAEICYVYLSDVIGQDDMDEFAKSRWFTRGWTLQELLAPFNLMFYNRNWQKLGTKQSRISEVSIITNIPKNILSCEDSIYSECVAERMKWASR
jgi:hypothetical protein